MSPSIETQSQFPESEQRKTRSFFEAAGIESPIVAERLQNFLKSGEWMNARGAEWRIRTFEGDAAERRTNTVEVSISLWDMVTHGLTLLVEEGVLQEKDVRDGKTITALKQEFVRRTKGSKGTRLRVSFPLDAESKEMTAELQKHCQETYKTAEAVGYYAPGWTGDESIATLPGSERANLWLKRQKSGNVFYLSTVGPGMDEANFDIADPKIKKRLQKEGYSPYDYHERLLLELELLGIVPEEGERQLNGPRVYLDAIHSMAGAAGFSLVEKLSKRIGGRLRALLDSPAIDHPGTASNPNMEWAGHKIDLKKYPGMDGLVGTAGQEFNYLGLTPFLQAIVRRTPPSFDDFVLSITQETFVGSWIRSRLKRTKPSTQDAHIKAVMRRNPEGRYLNFFSMLVCQKGGLDQPGDGHELANPEGIPMTVVYCEDDELVNANLAIEELKFAAEHTKGANQFAVYKFLPRGEAGGHYFIQYEAFAREMEALRDEQSLPTPVLKAFRVIQEAYLSGEWNMRPKDFLFDLCQSDMPMKRAIAELLTESIGAGSLDQMRNYLKLRNPNSTIPALGRKQLELLITIFERCMPYRVALQEKRSTPDLNGVQTELEALREEGEFDKDQVA